MDCRKCWWLCFGLTAGLAGCVTNGTTTQQTPLPTQSALNPTPVPIKVEKEKELPKKPPSPAVCVAFGNVAAAEAADVGRSPAAADELRDRARHAYQQALDLDPNNLEAIQAMARLNVAAKDHDRAIATFQRGIKAHPKEGSLWFEMGMFQSQCKEWPAAIESLRQALALDPENRHYAKTLGFCLARAGRFDESVICLAQAMGPAEAHYNVARMQLHLKQDEAAKQHLQMALQADPEHKEAQQLLARLEAPTGQQLNLSSDPSPAPPPAGKAAATIGLDD
jgi:tetratricopeptide (TPR) repeat protein